MGVRNSWKCLIYCKDVEDTFRSSYIYAHTYNNIICAWDHMAPAHGIHGPVPCQPTCEPMVSIGFPEVSIGFPAIPRKVREAMPHSFFKIKRKDERSRVKQYLVYPNMSSDISRHQLYYFRGSRLFISRSI